MCERHAERTGCRLLVALETSSFSVILEAVRSGVAASVLPVEAVANQCAVFAVPLAEKGELGLIGCWRGGEPLGQPSESLLDFLLTSRHVVQ